MSQEQEQQPDNKVGRLIAELEGAVTMADLLEEVAKQSERVRGQINLTERGVDFGNYEGALRLAREFAKGGMVPKSFEEKNTGAANISAIALAMLAGRRVGLDPLAAVQSIMVVNGIPTLWGGAPLAVCFAHPKVFDAQRLREYWEVDGQIRTSAPDPADFQKDTTAAVAIVARVGGEEYVSRFSVAHAKKAGLWGSDKKLYGPYAQRMLKHRALGFAIRDRFPDLLLGLGIQGITTADDAGDDDDVIDQQPPARSTVLDRVAASAPAALIPTPVQEEKPPAPVELPPAKPAAAVVPPAALADLVAEVTAPEPERKGQADLGGAVVKAAIEEQRAAATTQVQQSDSGEPDLAPLSAENATKLLAYAKLKAVKNPDVLAKLVAGHTEPGRYSQEDLRTFLKEEITKYETGTSQRTGAV